MRFDSAGGMRIFVNCPKNNAHYSVITIYLHSVSRVVPHIGSSAHLDIYADVPTFSVVTCDCACALLNHHLMIHAVL